MITKEYSEGLTEVLAILDNTEIEYVNKIPEKVRNFFRENASRDYVPNFNLNDEIKDMDLLKETKQILSVIYMNYWAENDEEKKQFSQILRDNQKEVDEEIREKYDPSKIFESKTENFSSTTVEQISNEPVKQEEALVEYKENFIQKLFHKIKGWIQNLIDKNR